MTSVLVKMVPSILKIRNFRNLWIGQTISQFGDAVYGLLFLFMTDKITHRSELVGAVAAATALPFLLFGPLAGVLADRVDRRRVMINTSVFSAVILAAFAILVATSVTLPVWSLLVTPFLLSSVNAFFLPARGAAVPSLVPESNLLEATAFSSASMNLMQTIGLMLAALLLGPLEAANPSQFFLIAVLVNLATFVWSVPYLFRLPTMEPSRTEVGPTKLVDDFKEGMKVLTRHPVLRVFFATNVVVQLSISGFMVVCMATNRQWFDGKFSTLALVELTFLVAIVASSLIVPKFKIKRVGLAFAIGLFVVGVDVAAMGWARSVPLYCVGNVIAGLVLPFVNIPYMTYLNLAVPDNLRGRMNSFQAMVSAGVQPVGASISGFGIDALGLLGMYVVMGCSMALSALAPLASAQVRAQKIPEVPSG